uniref:Uncharacterized protein n=1 Tax=Fundulus heteroclitus TaxID=8078 RepID=A0A3Q2QXF8_FUNHE
TGHGKKPRLRIINIIISDDVLFSNFRSPEYIRALKDKSKPLRRQMLTGWKRFSFWHRCLDRSAERQPAGFCPWHPESPCHGISSAGSRQRINIHQELHWWRPAENPSSLHTDNKTDETFISAFNLRPRTF